MENKIEYTDVEVWKDIEGYKGIYQVSTHGRVKSLKYNKERILKAGINNSGYYYIVLSLKNKFKNRTIHQLVAITFLNHTPCGHKIVVDHINGDKSDNHVSNLQLISNRENTSKDRKGGSSKYVGVYWSKRDSKWASQIGINGKVKNLGYFKTEEDAAQAYQDKLKEITQ